MKKQLQRFHTPLLIILGIFFTGFSILSCAPPVLDMTPGEEVTINNGEVIEFIVTIIDPDTEEKSVRWLIDGQSVFGETDTSFIYRSPMVSSEETVTVTAEVLDKRLMRNEISTEITILPMPFAHIDLTGDFTYTLDFGAAPRDVYFIFTNPSTVETARPEVRANFISKSIGPSSDQPGDFPPGNTPTAQRGTPEITVFNGNPPSFGSRNASAGRTLFDGDPWDPLLDAEGVGGTLNDRSSSIAATCRKIVSANSTTLNIWVADADWGVGAGDVTIDMVNALADKFLKAGDRNDIFEWITNIYGDEWGSHGFSNIIGNNNEITIVLYDIAGDDLPGPGEGRVVGYFDSINNFTQESQPQSNERIMFFADAALFANDTYGGGWSITEDYWPSEVVSTLAHEFQHMIHFYQKGVLHGVNSDIWLNEMCSLAAEDFVSDKIEADGPRGVDYSDGSSGAGNNTADRLARYNYYDDYSLITWGTGDTLIDYGLAYSFGAYLARNYYGPELFKNIVQNGGTDHTAIELAMQEMEEDITFPRALQRWGVSVLLSNYTNMPEYYQYNAGGFFTTAIGGIDYNMGSINLYNYRFTDSEPDQIGPKIYTGPEIGQSELAAGSNTFYLAGSGLTGENSWEISLPENIKLSAIFR